MTIVLALAGIAVLAMGVTAPEGQALAVSGAPATSPAAEAPLLVDLDPLGRLKLMGEPVASADALVPAIQKLGAKPGATITLRAHQGSEWSTVNELAGKIAMAGYGMKVSVQPGEEPVIKLFALAKANAEKTASLINASVLGHWGLEAQARVMASGTRNTVLVRTDKETMKVLSTLIAQLEQMPAPGVAAVVTALPSGKLHMGSPEVSLGDLPAAVGRQAGQNKGPVMVIMLGHESKPLGTKVQESLQKAGYKPLGLLIDRLGPGPLVPRFDSKSPDVRFKVQGLPERELSTVLRGLFGSAIRVVSDRRTSELVVQGDEKTLDTVKQVVKELAAAGT